jgi:hypothetical protein
MDVFIYGYLAGSVSGGIYRLKESREFLHHVYVIRVGKRGVRLYDIQVMGPLLLQLKPGCSCFLGRIKDDRNGKVPLVTSWA